MFSRIYNVCYLCLLLYIGAFSASFNIQGVYQVKENDCWAANICMILKHYQYDVTYNQIYVAGGGTENTDNTLDLYDPDKELPETAPTCLKLFNSYGLSENNGGRKGTMTMETINGILERRRPIFARFLYMPEDEGHFLTIYGCNTSLKNISYWDSYKEGVVTELYSIFCDRGDGRTWSHYITFYRDGPTTGDGGCGMAKRWIPTATEMLE
jgi:hypothetical protein